MPRIWSYRKVGGIKFLRVWKLQLSFCVCRKPLREQVRTAPFPPIRALRGLDDYPFATMVAIRER